MTLDGMEKVIADKFHTTQKDKFKNKVNLVRYADDYIVTATSKETALEVKDILKSFLKERGLELSEEKTLVTHIDEGFDMLGWNFRKYDGKLIIKPSRKSIQNFKNKLSETIITRGKTWTQENLIIKLNQQIRGWVNYNQSVCSAKVFSYIDIEERDIILKIPKAKGGTESVANMNYVHKNCKIMYQSCCVKT